MYYFQKQKNFPLRASKLIAVAATTVSIGLIVSLAVITKDYSPKGRASAAKSLLEKVDTSAQKVRSLHEAAGASGQEMAARNDSAEASAEQTISYAVAEKIRGVALMVELSEQQRIRLEHHFRQRIALSAFRGSPESLQALRAEIEPFEAIVGAEVAASYRSIESKLGEQRAQLLFEQSLAQAISAGEFSTEFRTEILNELHLATNAGLSFPELRHYIKNYLRTRVSESQARLLENALSGDRYIQGEQFKVLRQATENERRRAVQYYQNSLGLSDTQAGELSSLQSDAFSRYQELMASGTLAQSDAMREVTAEYRRALEQLLTAKQWQQYEKLQGGAQRTWQGL